MSTCRSWPTRSCGEYLLRFGLHTGDCHTHGAVVPPAGRTGAMFCVSSRAVPFGPRHTQWHMLAHNAPAMC
jgi:hypothetical protein